MILPIHQPDCRAVTPKLYRFYAPWVQYFPLNSDDSSIYRFAIPEGRQMDGASIPWWAWSILRRTPDGLLRAAAGMHDEICRSGGRPFLVDVKDYYAHDVIKTTAENYGIPFFDTCTHSYMKYNLAKCKFEVVHVSSTDAAKICIQAMAQADPELSKKTLNLFYAVLIAVKFTYWGKRGPGL